MKLIFVFFIKTLIISCRAYTVNNTCQCVPIHRCFNETNQINGVGLIDIRSEGTCKNYLETCCEPSHILTPEQQITPKPQYHQGCGKRNEDGVGFRIIGNDDNETQFGEFPWMVALLDKRTGLYVCGGALIHPQVVLTAAHCVKGKPASIVKVRAGEWDCQTVDEILPYQELSVTDIVLHENFHAGNGRNDIALLKLTSSFENADNIDVICLPDLSVNADYQNCIATGWGKNAFGPNGRYQAILRKIELPIVPHDICQEQLRDTRLGQTFNLHDSFICAGGEVGQDTCKGDGGSPLICSIPNSSDRYYQAGIVSWGIGCGDKVPGVYASVARAKSWIDSKMSLWNFDDSTYTHEITS